MLARYHIVPRVGQKGHLVADHAQMQIWAAIKLQRLFRRVRKRRLESDDQRSLERLRKPQDSKEREDLQKKSKSELLYMAVERDDLVEIEYLLSNDLKPPVDERLLPPEADLNWRSDETGLTALMVACKNGFLSATKRLMREATRDNRRLDPKIANDFGMTAVMFAAAGGHTACVEAILSINAQAVFSKDKDEWTPLIYAADAGHWAVCEHLVEAHNVELKSTSTSGETALMKAAANGHLHCVRFLVAVSRTDELTMRNRADMTPLRLAAFYGREDVVRELAAYDGDRKELKHKDAVTKGTLETMLPSVCAIEFWKRDAELKLLSRAEQLRFIRDRMVQAYNEGANIVEEKKRMETLNKIEALQLPTAKTTLKDAKAAVLARVPSSGSGVSTKLELLREARKAGKKVVWESWDFKVDSLMAQASHYQHSAGQYEAAAHTYEQALRIVDDEIACLRKKAAGEQDDRVFLLKQPSASSVPVGAPTPQQQQQQSSSGGLQRQPSVESVAVSESETRRLDPEDRQMLGVLLLRRQFLRKLRRQSISDWQRRSAKVEKIAESRRREVADSFFDMALAYKRRKRFDEAASWAQVVLRAFPGDKKYEKEAADLQRLARGLAAASDGEGPAVADRDKKRANKHYAQQQQGQRKQRGGAALAREQSACRVCT